MPFTCCAILRLYLCRYCCCLYLLYLGCLEFTLLDLLVPSYFAIPFLYIYFVNCRFHVGMLLYWIITLPYDYWTIRWILRLNTPLTLAVPNCGSGGMDAWIGICLVPCAFDYPSVGLRFYIPTPCSCVVTDYLVTLCLHPRLYLVFLDSTIWNTISDSVGALPSFDSLYY